MKITIGKTQDRQINIPVKYTTETPEVWSARVCSWLLGGTRSESDLVSALSQTVHMNLPDFNVKSGISTTYSGMWEFLVRCVQTSRLTVLDWIFDNDYASVEHIASNGSPLLLFAIQSSNVVFQYMISRGARLIKDGDFIRNETKHLEYVNVMYAASGTDIKNVLFNFVDVHLHEVSLETLKDLQAHGSAQKRCVTRFDFRIKQLEEAKSIEKERADILAAEKALQDLISAKAPNEKVLMSLVASKCNSVTDFRNVGKGLAAKEILSAMYASLAHTSLDTFYALCNAFPQHRIQ